MINPAQQKRPPIKNQTKRKLILKKRKNGTTRVLVDFSDTVSRTKPEFANEVDINNIVRMPLPMPVPLSYGDLTSPPDLERVFATVHDVKSNFMKLPSDIRRLIDNDPSKLHSFMTDPQNLDLLISRGVVLPREQDTTSPQEPVTSSKKAPKSKKVSKDPEE